MTKPNHHYSITKRSRTQRQRPPKPAVATAPTNVEFHSVLRIRPLLKKEKDDHVVLEPAAIKKKDVSVAVLHPMAHLTSPDPSSKRPSGNLSSPKFIQEGRQEDFHFDTILDANASQDNVYYSLGLNMATNSMEPLKKSSTLHVHNHVALVMGVANSGKTHTTFGDLKELGRPGRHEQDGLVPRILESLFSQSKHHVNHKKSFAVRMTLMHVENDAVHDLLLESSITSSATPPSSKKKSGVMAMVANLESAQKTPNKQVQIEQDPTTHDYIPNATVKTCWSVSEARQVLQGGLSRGLSSKFAGFAKGHSRGHTLLTIQPVIIRGARRDSTAVDRCGGTITFLDMAGMERSKTNNKSRGLRDAIADNSCLSAVQHVLRSIKHNQDVSNGMIMLQGDSGDEDTFDGSELSNVSEPKVTKSAATMKPVPYRQSKVTMLLQPFFSNAAQWNLDGRKTTTVVTTMLTAYPGHKDYTEKRCLLNDMELLFGSDIAKRVKHTVDTGLDTPKHVDGAMTMGDDTTSSLEMSDDDHEGEEQVVQVAKCKPVPFPSPSLPLVAPSAPSLGYDEDDEVLEPLPPPYAPGSEPNVLAQVSAPPIDQVYPLGAADMPIASTPIAPSPALHTLPTSLQRRTQVVDLPGVSIPPKASNSPFHLSSTLMRAPTPPSITQHSPKIESTPNAVPSPRYASPPLSSTHHNKPSPSIAKAYISATPNIQPPRSINKENPLSPSARKELSPNRSNWKDTSPIKTISRAVQSSKKQGKRAFDKVDKMMDRTITKRMSNEFEPNEDVSTRALLQRVKTLERQNERLTEKNEILTEKCERLTMENEELKRTVQSSKMQWRKDCWTVQDEQEWQRSKRLRMEEQDLIRGPLREHLENVQMSYESSNQWMRPTKVPFSLQFPSNWQRAAELDERDRAMKEGITAPPSTPSVPQADTFAPSSSQKRRQLSAFKKRLDMMQSNKRYKQY